MEPIKMISAYRGLENYLDATQRDPARDLNKLWWDFAMQPFWADWAAGQFNLEKALAGSGYALYMAVQPAEGGPARAH
jgi:hypothetical protein